MRFTGHERDEDPAAHGNDLDYIHARFYSPKMGRILSLDPILGSPGFPQSWNRYAYVMGNPVTLLDPRGLTAYCFSTDKKGDHSQCEEILLQIAGNDASAVSVNENGELVVNATEAQLESNVELNFLHQLAANQKTFGIATGSSVVTSGGTQTLAPGGNIVNVFRTPDQRVLQHGLTQEHPPFLFDGLVGIGYDAASARFESAKVGTRPADLMSLTFHELVENFFIEAGGIQYAPAHDLAIKVEERLRQQRPELRSFAFGAGPYSRIAP